MSRFILFLLALLCGFSARGAIGLNESPYTITLKPLTTALAWRTALGIADAGSGLTNVFNSAQFTPINGTNINLKDGLQATNVSLAGNTTNTALTASRAMVTAADQTQASSATTAAEIGHLSGVTSALQTQLGGKQSTLTDSAGLAAAISDETGTGKAVFSSGPSITNLVIFAFTNTGSARFENGLSILGDTGIGVAAAANTRLSVKSATADSSTYIFNFTDSGAFPYFSLRSDGLLLAAQADYSVGTAGKGLVSNSTGAEIRFPAGGNVDITSITPGITKITRALVVVPFTLTDGANIATDAGKANHFRVTLAGNRTLDNPTSLTDGGVYMWEFIQDGTGSRTITLGSAFALGTDVSSVTLTVTASKRDFMTCVYNSTAAKLFVVDFKKGY